MEIFAKKKRIEIENMESIDLKCGPVSQTTCLCIHKMNFNNNVVLSSMLNVVFAENMRSERQNNRDK